MKAPFYFGIIITSLVGCDEPQALRPERVVHLDSSVTIEEKAILLAYVAKYANLLKWCGNQTVKADVTQVRGPNSNPKEKRDFKIAFYSNDESLFRNDEFGGRTAVDRLGHGTIVTSKKIEILRPEGMVTIGNAPTSDNLSIENLRGNNEENMDRIRSYEFPWCVCSVRGAPVLDFVIGPAPAGGKYTIKKVQLKDLDGRSTIEVSSDCEAERLLSTYRLLIDEESGALREYEFKDIKSGQSIHGRTNYEFSTTNTSGTPQPKQHVSWAIANSETYNLTTYTATFYSIEPASLELFNPSSFGVKVVFPRSRKGLLWVGFFGAGMVCLLLYIVGRQSRGSFRSMDN